MGRSSRQERRMRARASGSGPRRQDSLEDDPAHALQFRPPTPPPQPTVVKWFYLDPKALSKNWLREGYLPPELPSNAPHPPPPQPETEPEPEPEPETTPQATEPEEITTTVEVIHGATTPAAPTAEDSIPPFGQPKRC
ncbi:hypothetical protein RhiLY_04287 [Ceratobasidium sp. AG-Ba]|nr:hypothetical protein RhiLY_04287 [Ceratobasidium sp. AG-Ba]